MAKRKTIVRYEGAPIGNWMVTFSDMNTLLLTFFVLLFSMSSLSVETFRKAFSAMSQDGLGLMSEAGYESTSGAMFDPIPEIAKNSVYSALGRLRFSSGKSDVTQGQISGEEPVIIDSPDGTIEVVITDQILFRPGSSQLTERAEEYLDRVRNYLLDVLSVSNRRIRIEGYDDGSSPGEEPFYISAGRAYAVLEYLLRDGTLPPERFSLIGYGDAKPAERGIIRDEGYRKSVRIVVGPEEETIFSMGS